MLLRMNVGIGIDQGVTMGSKRLGGGTARQLQQRCWAWVGGQNFATLSVHALPGQNYNFICGLKRRVRKG